MKPLTSKAINRSSIANRPGIYRFYNSNGKVIYVGRSKYLRKRLQSYVQKDDFQVHPTKNPLRREATHFSYEYTDSVLESKRKEKAIKDGKKHNHI